MTDVNIEEPVEDKQSLPEPEGREEDEDEEDTDTDDGAVGEEEDDDDGSQFDSYQILTVDAYSFCTSLFFNLLNPEQFKSL